MTMIGCLLAWLIHVDPFGWKCPSQQDIHRVSKSLPTFSGILAWLASLDMSLLVGAANLEVRVFHLWYHRKAGALAPDR